MGDVWAHGVKGVKRGVGEKEGWRRGGGDMKKAVGVKWVGSEERGES